MKKRILAKRNIVITGLFALVLAFGLAGCGGPSSRIYTSTLFAMDTVMELEIAGPSDYTLQAEQMIRALEKELSVTDEGSEIAKLNKNGTGMVSGQVSEIIERALDVCDRTEGALDISIYPVLRAWGFTTGEYRVPSDDEIEKLLANVDYRKIVVEKEGAGGGVAGEDVGGDDVGAGDGDAVGAGGAKVTIPEGAMMDLGSVAKGYTGTYVADELRKMGVTSALLNLGGNVQCIGTKPNGDKWKVAVKSPFEDSTTGMLGVVEADDVAIITSGGYERYFEENGVKYWHILDPETGKPADSGLESVTVVGRDGLVCDGMSTALFVKGLDEATEVWRESNDFEAVFVTKDRKVYVTEGLAKDFSLTAEYGDVELTVITR
ncbi:FAD:protein FMN transferase [Butyrivibrio sp. FCS014]|uniref:FAD:protein FMN transferase n=1 Tax=Butyrivibrio sp. FCS014 TaxID=1408304 RepID=UPI0004B2DB8B|nr:FAD:protein FMN transferase [Butyrivibrio sp. FCS014]